MYTQSGLLKGDPDYHMLPESSREFSSSSDSAGDSTGMSSVDKSIITSLKHSNLHLTRWFVKLFLSTTLFNTIFRYLSDINQTQHIYIKSQNKSCNIIPEHHQHNEEVYCI